MANSIQIKGTIIHVGDTIKLAYSLGNQDKQKDQQFNGIVMSIKGKGSNKMFLVRKMSKSGIGVERIFPVLSPFIKGIKIEKRGRVRRAKLNYIRNMSDKLVRERLS